MLMPKSTQLSFYVNHIYDRVIPEDHFLKLLNRAVDFSFVNELCRDAYTPEFGRPAYAPEMMFKILYLQFLYDISDRRVEEEVTFKVPALVSEQLWQKANAGITERGRGKGKQGQSIKALLRNRIYCPRCGRPMVVKRHARQQRTYYYCSKYYRPWAENPCSYNRFVPGSWDELVWDCVYALLNDDVWLEQQLASKQSQDENMAKLLKLHQYKISQAQSKIARVREGFEGGIYNLDEAKQRIAGCEAAIAKAEQEFKRLQAEMNRYDAGAADIEAVKRQLKGFRDRNLDEASFEDKLDVIVKLGIKVYPSEDLKTMRVTCGLNLQFEHDGEDENAVECRKVMFGSLVCERT